MREKAVFYVEKPGLYSTVQDLGRSGHQEYGIVVGGAMDTWAHKLANKLVGNKSSAATIEMTLLGPTLRALEDVTIAIGGADLGATIDGNPLMPFKSTHIKKGSLLAFGEVKSGVRAYLAVAGGIASEKTLNSRSTYASLNAGYELARGQELHSYLSKNTVRSGRRPVASLLDVYQDKSFRVITGPDEHAFVDEQVKRFFLQTYTITTESDRMGYRLTSERPIKPLIADIISDATTMGTIQIPGEGYPMILLADRQTTGGYPRIGTIARVDLPRLAQRKPGDKINFEQISVQDAQRELRKMESIWKRFSIFADS
ncbi:biotin-dependent carboxyltransferase [Paenalkalicoccus suaedae]|uniref:Biotin-dependent carboxyltransferase n=1 Tax=Paenalkalicoccus suaedae TaxID=2592382 RepID=A0A859FH26_9BACI|nr:biotin-dependent carboxyltransferase family protein [Paenalkalicoccus suaedae]QKS72427.1 biotin-dependent carboxyltransferase [Paenalkalicoccus suaedae]